MNYLKKHGVGDFLNHIFTLAPRMWKTVVPVAAVVFLPAGLAYVMGFNAMGSAMEGISQLRGAAAKDIWPALMPMVTAFAWILGAGVWFAFANSLVNALVTDQAVSLIAANVPDGGAFQRALSHKALTLLGQSLIIASLMTMIILIMYAAVIGVVLLLVAQFGQDMSSTKIGLLTAGLSFALILAFMPAVYWLNTKVSVAPQVAVAEKTGGFIGIGRSFQLVRGHSWRVFGVTFVIGLVIGFALSILTGPIIFIFVLPGYMEFLKNALAGNGGSPESMVMMFKSMSWGIGISFYLQSVAMGLVWPIFQSLLYTDLRIRHGEVQEVLPPPKNPVAPIAITEPGADDAAQN